MARLPVTPMVLSRASPPAKYSKVGTDWMPYRAARAGFVSTLTLATFTWPACSVAISSSKGAIILHGPHHSAQKSTRTGWLDWTTSLSKLVSLISMAGFIFHPHRLIVLNPVSDGRRIQAGFHR